MKGVVASAGPTTANTMGAARRVALAFSISVLSVWVLLALAAPLLAPSERERDLLGSTDIRTLSLLPPLTAGTLVPSPTQPERFVFQSSSSTANAQQPQQAAKTSIRFWLGTDRLGRDLAASLAKGARTSLVVGLCATLFAVVIGIGVGTTAGLSSSWVDGLLMRLVDAMLAFPLLLLVLLLDLLFDPGLLALIVILGGAQWMSIARLVRAEMLRLRVAPFVVAARAVGQRGVGLVVRHLLPNALRPILLSGLLLVGDSILLESTVAFLGFGTATDLESWGRLVDQGRPYLIEAWWISAIPGLAIVMVVTALNLLGEAHLRRPLSRRAA